MINIELEAIISENCKSYKIITSNRDFKIGEILLFRGSKYKITEMNRYGIKAFKILKSGISSTTYINIDSELNYLNEKYVKGSR